jgi:transcriptional regulator with XRE-family HTH domain
MIFETKKVPLETLGEYLAVIRTELGLKLSEVVEKTGISEKNLQHLEAGSYHHLPPDVYVRGFLKKLSELYAIPAETLLSQYQKERGIVSQVANNIIAPSTGWKARLSKMVITPKLISFGGGVALVLVAMGYMIFQVSAINETPELKIMEPAAGSVVRGSFVNVEGQTDAGAVVSINGQNVFVDTEGKFQTTLGVAPGQKELEMNAQNKFGKQVSQKILVVVESSPPIVAGDSTVSLPIPALQLELKFSRGGTIEITRDGVRSEVEIVAANDIKKIDAVNSIILKTSDAGSVSAVLNDRQLGVLGRSKEELVIPFSAESVTVLKSN